MPNEKDDAAWWLHLDKLRRSIDLRLDREGHWWHDGRAFEHQGIIDTLNRGLDLNHSTGEAIVRVGEQWCFIKVDVTPFLGTHLRWLGEDLSTLLNTQQWTTIDLSSFRYVGDQLFATEALGRLVRFNRHAVAHLAERFVEGPGGYCLRTTSKLWPIKT